MRSRREGIGSTLYLRQLIFILILIPVQGCAGREVLNRGEFGDFSISLNQRSYGYQIVKDPTGQAPTKDVEKFLVKSGDCGISPTWNDCKTDRERSELSEKKHDNSEGQSYWYGWSIYFPKDFPVIYPVKVALGQFHQEKGSPLWMFQMLDTGYILEPVFLDNDSQFPLLSENELRGRWHKIEIAVLWSKKSDGYFKVWVNGIEKVQYRGPTKEDEPVFFKYGLYRSFLSRYQITKSQKNIPTQEIYFSNVKRASSREGLRVGSE